MARVLGSVAAAVALAVLGACGGNAEITVGGTGQGGSSGLGAAGDNGGGAGSVIVPNDAQALGGNGDACSGCDEPSNVCGDGVLGPGETCDDGNQTPGDGCSGTCAIEPGFECKTPGQPCVQTVLCGNGKIDAKEACDDGNAIADDGCSPGCTVEQGWACKTPGQPCEKLEGGNGACGDGTVNSGEECDDGDTTPGDGCSDLCKLESHWTCPQPGEPCEKVAYCGDGVVQADRGEECDDGNATPGDGCSGLCKLEAGYECPDAGLACIKIWVCGNGTVDPGEKCDDGNAEPLDGCSADCTLVEPGWTCSTVGQPCVKIPPNICGDGIRSASEECDDHNTTPGDGCSDKCFVESGWTCPTPNTPCVRIAYCGDGKVDLSLDEQCDDGNTTSGDGCTSLCHTEPDFYCPPSGGACQTTVVCGDGVVSGSEQCDDHNTTPGDGCDANCQIESGWACPFEGLACMAARCGDGILAGSEQCEFKTGETPATKPGCNASCQIAVGYDCGRVTLDCAATICGNTVIERGEQCDDGNARPFDGCYECKSDPRCTAGVCTPVCGDGQRYAGEACDDGNTISGDGCSSTCRVERGFNCTDVTAQPADTIELPVILRDFIGNGNAIAPAVSQIDFNKHNGTGCPGIVTSALDANDRPIFNCPGGDCTQNPGRFCDTGGAYGPNTSTKANFDQWFTDVPGVNLTVPDKVVLHLQKTGPLTGSYVYDSADTTMNGGKDYFDPLLGKGWDNAGKEKLAVCGPDRNCSFTTETQFWFEYAGGERFDFAGDDDAFVYLNGKLAIDLGGLHTPLWGYLVLDASNGTAQVTQRQKGSDPAGGVTTTVDFGLTLGGVYKVVMFQAERNQCGSNFKVTLKNFNRPKSICVSSCGDGIVASDEVCDDGTNTGGYNGCMPGCKKRGPYCGDGSVSNAEACDDGVNKATYGNGSKVCGPGCQWAPYCGDGVVSNGEQCDEGTGRNGSGYGHCTADCRLGPRCGDGITNGAEQCDDGIANGTTGSGCTALCTSKCGNGTTDPGEQCDEGAANNKGGYGKCNPDCTLGPHCGDGFKNGSEQCDDGRNDGSYGTCRPDCTLADYCGDGATNNPPEICDRGTENSASAYGKNKCSGRCTPAPYCGDGRVDGAFGETCDDGVNSGAPGSCATDCKSFIPVVTCGNAVKDPGEECDDGTNNGKDQSTCDAYCRLKCGNGIKDKGEACDNGLNDGTYGTCRPDCTLADYCGDGAKNGPERCDKGLGNVSLATAYGQGVCTMSCTWAPFCGDGRVQSQFGEECDGTSDCDSGCKHVNIPK